MIESEHLVIKLIFFPFNLHHVIYYIIILTICMHLAYACFPFLDLVLFEFTRIPGMFQAASMRNVSHLAPLSGSSMPLA